VAGHALIAEGRVEANILAASAAYLGNRCYGLSHLNLKRDGMSMRPDRN